MSEPGSQTGNPFIAVEDPDEAENLLKEAARTVAPTLIWTKNQERTVTTRLSLYSHVDRCLYAWVPKDFSVEEFEKELEEMSVGDFEKHKIGLINKRLEKLKNLGEETGRLWHHVSSEAFDFDLGKLYS